MRVRSFISVIVYLFRPSYTWFWGSHPLPWLEEWHYPGAFTTKPSPFVNGTYTKISDELDTPDYRIEEPHFLPLYEKGYTEYERPYRHSPAAKQSYKAATTYWYQVELHSGCICNTVYRRHTLLSSCAVITTRHILTTATPTALILRSYSHLKSLENILGGWYDHNGFTFNSSMYMTPARIHIHPHYTYEHEVNISHPIPAMYDLCIWASTHRFIGSGGKLDVITCVRAASSWKEYASTIPRYYDVSVVAGFMFIKAYKRRPMPWFRYIVKSQMHLWPCPKSDWQWYHCVMGEYWGRFGFDSGGGMSTGYGKGGWRTDGFAGMCAFSLKLRSKQTVHYFTVIDTYPVLDFMYDAFLGLIRPVYLDDRFEDTKWGAPVPWWGEYVYVNFVQGVETYYYSDIPRYRR